MPMTSGLDATLLPSIEEALSQPEHLPLKDAKLRVLYDATEDAGRRPYNRLAIGVSIVFFDLFLLTNMATVPSLVPISAALRLGVATPLGIAFVLVDWRGRLKPFYDSALCVLAVLPAAIAGVLALLIHLPAGLPDVQAMPLILLVTGMVWRLKPRMAFMNAIVSTTIFVAADIFCTIAPRAQLGSMILTSIAICAASVLFTRRLDARDRRVFLLHVSEQLHRALIVEQNSGLLRAVHTDTLTGVANRYCFDETLASSWQEAKRAGSALALIMIDVDHFKEFNDLHGHQGGDECLRQVAAQLRHTARTSDFVARYGGEEFAVILSGASIEVAAEVAERLRASVAALHVRREDAGGSATVTISLGVVSATPGTDDTVNRLLEVADRRLYSAKHAGRNQVRVLDSAVGDRLQQNALPAEYSA